MTFFSFLLGALLSELAHYLHRLHKGRIRLNLTLEGKLMKVGDSLIARIAPTAADGTAAPVTGAVFSVSDTTAFSVAPAPNGLSAVYIALTAGTGRQAIVSAVSAAGISLSDSAPLDDVIAAPPVTPEAVKLNLSVSAA